MNNKDGSHAHSVLGRTVCVVSNKIGKLDIETPPFLSCYICFALSFVALNNHSYLRTTTAKKMSSTGAKRSAQTALTTEDGAADKRARVNGHIRSDFEADPYLYMSGFGNEFATEALEGALPKGQNNPQKVS